MSNDFHQTPMGKAFYDVYVPRIAYALETIAEKMTEQNNLIKSQLGIEDIEGEEEGEEEN